MANIAIFASGGGSNADRIIRYFQESDTTVSLLISNKLSSGAVEKAKALEIPIKVFNKQQFEQSTEIINLLVELKVDLIVLAGFLLKINLDLINAFPDRIINLHPSLLPKYGGKGMYGSFVHQAVLLNKEKYSGISIHLINEHFDEGRILEQHKVKVDEADTMESLSQKIQQLEHEYFPKAIKQYLLELKL